MEHPALHPSRVNQGHVGTGLVHIGACSSHIGQSAVVSVMLQLHSGLTIICASILWRNETHRTHFVLMRLFAKL